MKERITHSFNLLPLPARDIKDYLNFRLRAAGYHGPDLFSPEALKLITEASEGLTRRINIYADKTLLAAYAGGTHTITPDHVRAAITDTQIILPAPKSSQKKLWFAITASLLAGAVIGFAAGRYTTSAPAASVTSAPTSAVQPVQGAIQGVSKSPEAAITSDAKEIKPAPDTANPVMAGEATIAANPRIASPVASPAAVATPVPVSQGAPVATPFVSVAATPIAPAQVPVPSLAENPNKRPDADWLDKRMTADAARIAALPKERYGIQLMTADQRERPAIESYLRAVSRELNPDLIMVFPTGNADNTRVIVLYGNFDDRANAITGLGSLPARVSRFRPFVRSFDAVRNDVRSGTL